MQTVNKLIWLNTKGSYIITGYLYEAKISIYTKFALEGPGISKGFVIVQCCHSAAELSVMAASCKDYILENCSSAFGE